MPSTKAPVSGAAVQLLLKWFDELVPQLQREGFLPADLVRLYTMFGAYSTWRHKDIEIATLVYLRSHTQPDGSLTADFGTCCLRISGDQSTQFTATWPRQRQAAYDLESSQQLRELARQLRGELVRRYREIVEKDLRRRRHEFDTGQPKARRQIRRANHRRLQRLRRQR